MVSKLLFLFFRWRFWWQYRAMRKRALHALAARALCRPQRLVPPPRALRVLAVPPHENPAFALPD